MLLEDEVLRCHGFEHGDLIVPSFCLHRGMLFGISIPVPFGELWEGALQVLSGEVASQSVSVTQRGICVIPQFQSCRHVEDDFLLGTVIDRLEIPNATEQIMYRDLGVTRETPIEHLSATSRLLLELWNAIRRGTHLLVFSTAGLDPVGVKLAHREVEKNLNAVTGLHAFASTLESFYHSSVDLRKVVRCNKANPH